MLKSHELLDLEIKQLKNDLEWYKSTYEKRRLVGIVKDRLFKLVSKNQAEAVYSITEQQETPKESFVYAEEHLKAYEPLLEQNFQNTVLSEFEFKAANDCRYFFKFNLETLLAIGSKCFISGWLVDPYHCIKGIYLKYDEYSFTENLLSSLTSYPRPDVKEHYAQNQLEVEGDPGLFTYIDLKKEAKELDNIEIVFITTENEVVTNKCGFTHRDFTFINKLKLILSVIDVNSTDVFENFDKTVGSAISDLESSRIKPQLKPVVKEFGPQPAAPLVSVIIPLYGRYDFMQYQLSIFCNDPDFKNYEIIYVVDDPSIYKSVLQFGVQLFPIYEQPFKVVYSGRNLGYAGANNLGVSFASSANLLLLNSDVIPKHKGWLSVMLNEYLSLKNCGILGPKLLFEDNSVQHAGMAFDRFPFLDGFWLNEHPGKGLPTELLENDVKKTVPAVTGACMFISKSLYQKAGGFDERYILGDFEDSDLCLKVRELGYDIYYVPDVALYHLERKSQNLFGDLTWKHKLTLYNAWRHTKRWDKVISNLVSNHN